MKRQSTAKGFAILSFAGIAVRFMSLFYVPLLLKILGDVGYGIYYLTYQVFLFLYIITNSGMPSAISKQISEFVSVKNYKAVNKTFKVAKISMFVLGSFMSLIMIIFAHPFSHMLGNTKTYLAILALAPTIFLSSISSTYRGYFQGIGNMNSTAVSQVLEQIVNTVSSLLFAIIFLKYGIEEGCAGGTLGTSVAALASAAYLIIFYKRNNISSYPDENKSSKEYTDIEIFKKLLYFGVPMILCWGLQYAGNLVDTVNTVSRLKAAGFLNDQATIMIGNLGKYQTFLNVPITIISALSTAILPAIAGAFAERNKDKVKDGIEFAFKACFMVAVPCAVGLSILSHPVFSLFGRKFLGGAYLMKIGSVVLVLMAAVQIETTILQSIGKIYKAASYLIIGIVVKIITNYIFIAIPSININGAIIGSILGYIVPLVLNFNLLRKSLDIKINIAGPIIKFTLSSAVMGIFAFLTDINLIHILRFIGNVYFRNLICVMAAILIAVLTYFLALVFTGGITKKDMEDVPYSIRKIIPKKLVSRMR